MKWLTFFPALSLLVCIVVIRPVVSLADGFQDDYVWPYHPSVSDPQYPYALEQVDMQAALYTFHSCITERTVSNEEINIAGIDKAVLLANLYNVEPDPDAKVAKATKVRLPFSPMSAVRVRQYINELGKSSLKEKHQLEEKPGWFWSLFYSYEEPHFDSDQIYAEGLSRLNVDYFVAKAIKIDLSQNVIDVSTYNEYYGPNKAQQVICTTKNPEEPEVPDARSSEL